jgi:hypothetical protein
VRTFAARRGWAPGFANRPGRRKLAQAEPGFAEGELAGPCRAEKRVVPGFVVLEVFGTPVPELVTGQPRPWPAPGPVRGPRRAPGVLRRTNGIRKRGMRCRDGGRRTLSGYCLILSRIGQSFIPEVLVLLLDSRGIAFAGGLCRAVCRGWGVRWGENEANR